MEIKKHCITCTCNTKKRSIQQNRAYFGIAVDKIAEAAGYEPKIMHKALAGAFFGFIDVTIGDMVFKVPASTTGRTTKEFIEFYEFVQKIGAEKYGISIPSPNEIPIEAYVQ